jgi:hypothetical protein
MPIAFANGIIRKKFNLSVNFTSSSDSIGLDKLATASEVKFKSTTGWKKFWLSGGAVDFSGVKDKRAFEIERRAVLSQYLTKVQCSSAYPPQETGLTYNSWYGGN